MLHTVLTAALVASFSVPHAPRLLELAVEAGHRASARVFQTQETSEVERRCQAEADRERQVCLQEGKDNCDELYETNFAVCLATPPPVEVIDEGRNPLLWIGLGGVAVYAVIYIMLANRE